MTTQITICREKSITETHSGIKYNNYLCVQRWTRYGIFDRQEQMYKNTDRDWDITSEKVCASANREKSVARTFCSFGLMCYLVGTDKNALELIGDKRERKRQRKRNERIQIHDVKTLKQKIAIVHFNNYFEPHGEYGTGLMHFSAKFMLWAPWPWKMIEIN